MSPLLTGKQTHDGGISALPPLTTPVRTLSSSCIPTSESFCYTTLVLLVLCFLVHMLMTILSSEKWSSTPVPQSVGNVSVGTLQVAPILPNTPQLGYGNPMKLSSSSSSDMIKDGTSSALMTDLLSSWSGLSLSIAAAPGGGASANSEESELGQGLGGEVVGWSDSYRKVAPIGAPQHHPTPTNAMNFTETLTPPMSSSLWKHNLVNNYI